MRGHLNDHELEWTDYELSFLSTVSAKRTRNMKAALPTSSIMSNFFSSVDGRVQTRHSGGDAWLERFMQAL